MCIFCSPLEAFNEKLPGKVQYAKGCDISSDDTSGFNEAASIVKDSDEVVLIMGLDQSQEKEGLDRTDIVRLLLHLPAIVLMFFVVTLQALPGKQTEFIESMLQSAKSPVTLVIMSGGAVCLQPYKDDPRVGMIRWFYFVLA